MDEQPTTGEIVVRGQQRAGDQDGQPALSLGELLRDAHDRIGREEYGAALALLDDALAISPKCVPALVMVARCHLGRRTAVGALEAALRADRHASDGEKAGTQAVLAECARAAAPDVLEEVRAALRVGKLGRAVARADELATALPEDDEVADVHAYVYERLASSPSERARDRAGRGAPRALTPPALQKVLVWLVSDELGDGSAALDHREYARAVELLDRANVIDDRCAQVAYLQASAMYATVFDEVARPKPTGLDAAAENLRRAAMLADRAGASDGFADRTRSLRTRIDELARQVARETRVRPLARRFDALVGKYTGRTITYFEANTLRRSLAVLQAEVSTAHRSTSDPEERRQLAALHKRIIGLQRQVRHIV